MCSDFITLASYKVIFFNSRISNKVIEPLPFILGQFHRCLNDLGQNEKLVIRFDCLVLKFSGFLSCGKDINTFTTH